MLKNAILRMIIVFVSELIFFNANGQITITSLNMPAINDTIRYSSVLSYPGFDQSATGVDFNWDFSDLGLDNQGIYEYKSAVQTPYLFSFFGAMGLKIADSLGQGEFKLQNIYSFYQNSSSEFVTRGFGYQLMISGLPVPQKGEYTQVDKIYRFPLKFNDSTSNPFLLNIQLGLPPFLPNIGSNIREGIRTNVVDGWGKISTPYANDVACIRVKSTIIGKDSFNISMPFEFAGSFPVHEMEYKWLTVTEKIPLLEIKGNVVGGIFIPNQINYRDKYRGDVVVNKPPVVDFNVNKQFGYEKKDTFYFNGLINGVATSQNWSFSPSTDIVFVGGTSENSLNPRIVFSNPGYYNVSFSATNDAGTGMETKNNFIEIAANQNISLEKLNDFGIIVYPNPANDFIMILHQYNESDKFQLQINDLTGRVVKTLDLTEKESKVDISFLSTGIYQLRILTNQKQIIINQSLLKQ